MSECILIVFFFQAEDGIRDLVRSRGLGDVYKRQQQIRRCDVSILEGNMVIAQGGGPTAVINQSLVGACLLYTSDAADERSSVDLGGRRIIKKKHKRRHRSEVTTDRNTLRQRTATTRS